VATLGGALIEAMARPDQSGGRPVYAEVINTRGGGTWAWAAPTTSSHQSEGPGEGDTIVVVCQVRDGEPMTDNHDPKPSQPAEWPVWDRLDDGRYIPDLWTDLPKDTTATEPPNGLPHCPK
jgi:hypothetical protein